jgi:hypothetical protein
VYLRGIPYSCTEEEIVEFFEGIPIADGGIKLLKGAKKSLLN